MVASKMVPPNKQRRGGFNNGMPPMRPRFKSGGPPKNMNARNMGAMFNTNQLGDNPGFVDFNDDVQIPSATTTTQGTSAASTNGNNGTTSGPKRKLNPNQKRQNMKNGGGGGRRMPPGGMHGGGGYWGPPMMPPMMPPMFPMGGGRRGGPIPPPPPHFRVPPMGMRGMRGGPMMPPPPPNGRFGGPPHMGPGGPMSLMPRPMPPHMPPMRGGPMMGGRMMPPPMRNGPPMRRMPNGKLPPGGGRGPKGALAKGAPRGGGAAVANGKVVKAATGKAAKLKAKVPAKPREEYPLDKPWVTEEIKAEHDKKVELAERLKGNKDDALFAQFKEQRDKFVKMYDAARLEFIGKHPEQDVDKILTESVASKKAKTENQKSNDAVSTDTPAGTTTTTTAAAVAPAATPAATSTTAAATTTATTSSA